MSPRDLLDAPPVDPRVLLTRWETYARPAQLIAPERPIVNAKMGRGAGKTRLGNEHTLTLCERWGPTMRGLVASKTESDTVETLVLGPAGLVACARARGYELDYSASRGVITHPGGGVLQLGSGQQRELGRGFSLNFALLDELAWWEHAESAFANVRFALRLSAPAPGRHVLVTSTPSYTCRLRLDDSELVQTIRGRTADNASNLDAGVLRELERTYDGHPLGRQELDAEDVNLDGALVSLERIHELRLATGAHPYPLDRIVLAVDPGGFAVKDPMHADPTGAVVVALAQGELYVLAAVAITGDETKWAREVAWLYDQYGCGACVVETNQGGMMTLNTIARAAAPRRINVQAVTATKAKLDRALPTAQQYVLGKLHHCGIFRELETELATWSPKSGKASPNLLDALAHAVNELLPDDGAPRKWGILDLYAADDEPSPQLHERRSGRDLGYDADGFYDDFLARR